MKTKVDKFGRVLIPKRIRQASGLLPGTKVEVKCVNRTVRLTGADSEGRLVRKKNGTLVWSGGKLPKDFDIVKFIQEQREERVRQIWGRVQE